MAKLWHTIAGAVAPEETDQASRLYPDDVVFAVGSGVDALLAGMQDQRFVDDPARRFGLLVLLPGSDIDAVLGDLFPHARMPVPVADLTGSNHPRADYTTSYASPATLQEALAMTQELRRRLNELPVPEQDSSLAPLSALILAATRGKKIEAVIDPARPSFIDYPMLTGLADQRVVLEGLAEAGLLERHFQERVNVCSGCRSARLLAREVCPNCSSSQLTEHALVHHYRCGYEAERPAFQTSGGGLLCPKCDRSLKHYGVDYDTPAHVLVCSSCQARSTEPAVSFLCGDCGTSMKGEDVGTLDWFTYEPTPRSVEAVAAGHIPDIGWEMIAGIPGRRAAKEVGRFIEFAMNLNVRYERPFAVMTLNYVVPEEILSLVGHSVGMRLQSLLADIVRETVRDTDLITTLGDKIVLFLPETSPSNAGRVEERLNERVREAVGEDTGVVAEVVQPSALADLVARLLRA